MDKSQDMRLTTGSVTKGLLRYALPLIGTSVLQSVYSLVDIGIVGKFISASGAISAVNSGSLVMNLLAQIIIGLTMGGSVLISQYWGAEDDENRKQSAGTLFTLSIIFGVFAGIVFYFAAGPLMALLNVPALQEAASYLKICALGLPVIFGYNGIASILRAMGNSKMPLCFIGVATVVNVGLDLLFVAVLGYGVSGAAAATLIAQVIAFLLALLYLISKRAHYGFYAQYLSLAGDKLRRILRLGLPLALQWTIASISWLAVSYFINQYGAIVADGNGIASKIKDFCQIFITATTSAGSTMVAQNIGAGDYDRAKKTMWTCMKITVGMSILLIIIVQVAAPYLTAIFSSDSETIRWATRNLRIEIIGQVFYAIFFTFNVLATGSGQTLFVAFNTFVNCIIVRIVLAAIMSSIWGETGIYIACAIAPASSVPIGYIYYKRGSWINKIIGPGTARKTAT